MTLRARILGCGTSSGVPRIGNDWGACDPANPKNRRTRASILIESATTRLLIDTAPDLREQLLAAGIIDIDAVLWTHDHADHCHGIDDVRQLTHHRGMPTLCYARRETLSLMRRRFTYAFDGHGNYPPILTGMQLDDELVIGDIHIRCIDQPHGTIFSTGFHFSLNGSTIGYSTDFHEVTPGMIDHFRGVDIWIVDALRHKPHPTHSHLALTLDAIAAVVPQRSVLTHMDQSMDYETLRGILPPGVEPAYDGMVLELS